MNPRSLAIDPAVLDAHNAEVHADAMARGADCRACPLWGCHNGPVLGEIRPGSKLTIVGEAPGTQEVEHGRPFVGYSGKVLEEGLALAAMDRSQTTVTNAICCRPPGTNMEGFLHKLKRAHKKKVERAKATKSPAPPPLVTPQEACSGRLANDLNETGAKTVLAVGGSALSALASVYGVHFANAGKKAAVGTVRVATISKQHGSPVALGNGITLCASYHPAFAARPGNREYIPIVYADIAKAARIAQRDGKTDWWEPPFILAPSIDVSINLLEKVQADSLRHRLPVTIDLETDSKYPWKAKIRCIGFAYTFSTGEYVVCCIPTNYINGRPYWGVADKERLIQALLAFFRDANICGQNVVGFDSLVLDYHGLWPDRPGEPHPKECNDLMLGHHDSDHSELPHDLGFIMGRFTEAHRHKEDADSRHLENVSDYDLWSYNCRDAHCEHQLIKPIFDRVAATGQTEAYNVDRSLAPIARNMGQLGLIYDHQRRLDFFDMMSEAASRHLSALREITGRPDYNPASTQHVRDWLYGDLGLDPQLGTDGKPWEDNDKDFDPDNDDEDDREPSTSEAALQALIDNGVSDAVEKAIDTQLKWRGAEKIRGTYVGLKAVDEKGRKEALGRGKNVYEHKGQWLSDNSIVSWENSPYGMLPVLHPTWKIHTVVSGRWASSPNMQNQPSQFFLQCSCNGVNPHCKLCLDKKKEKPTGWRVINIRSMFVAPPGHVYFGADMEQIELRLYALLARDQILLKAFGTGLDPHALNFCHMMFGDSGEDAVWKEYHRFQSLGTAATWKKHPEVEYARTCAKRFCIAEGELVLTRQRGEVPIESVVSSDEVWDGVEWVHQDGVAFMGIKEVIEHDGLWATEDHEVWLSTGEKVQLGEAARRGAALARTGEGGKPLRFVLGGAEVCGATPELVAPRRRMARVYDIINAGPRHCFTVSDKRVCNCYLIVYGGELDALFATMKAERKPNGDKVFPGLTYAMVAKWYKNWHDTHPETKLWQNKCVRFWRTYGYSEALIDHRKRFFIGGLDRNAIINFFIQASAAAIVNRAIIRIAERFPHRGWSPYSGLNLQVHDFIGGVCPIEMAVEACQIIDEEMKTRIDDMSFPVDACHFDRTWANV